MNVEFIPTDVPYLRIRNDDILLTIILDGDQVRDLYAKAGAWLQEPPADPIFQPQQKGTP